MTSERNDSSDAHRHATALVYEHYDPEDEGRRAVLMSLGNGELLVRACPPEHAFMPAPDDRQMRYPGMYRAGLYNQRDTSIHGKRERSTFTPRLPDATPLAVRPEGAEWLSVESARLQHYRHALDMRRAVATRELLLEQDGRTTRIEELRFTSAAHPNIVVLRWRVTACDWQGVLEIGAGIDGDVRNVLVDQERAWGGTDVTHFQTRSCDPDTVLATAHLSVADTTLALCTRMYVNGASMPVPLEHGAQHHFELRTVEVQAGETVAIDRVIVSCTSRDGTVLDASDTVLALTHELCGDVDALQAAHERVWAARWRRLECHADDPRVANQLNLGAFHIAQALSGPVVHEDAGFPARGWQEGYQGHIFWDDMFVLPMLMRDCPEAARATSLYRYRRLPAARRAAAREGLRGAMFPWRSATTGDEETPPYTFNPLNGHWMPDHTRLERHVGAAVAWNAWHYWCMSGDDAFLAHEGGELLVEIARFWASLAKFDEARGRYVITGVIGPDEYHHDYPDAKTPGVDNNAYTNVMAGWSLRRAADALAALTPVQREDLTARLGLQDSEASTWQDIAKRMYVPFLPDGTMEQFDGFSALRHHSGAMKYALHKDRTDWRLEADGDSINAWQLCKQPDALMLLFLLGQKELEALLADMGYAFDNEAARRTLDYYLQRTTHESSLSKVVCAGALTHADLIRSYQHFQEALGVDTDPQASDSTAEGMHLGALGGTIGLVMMHYGGIEFTPGALRLFPDWPEALAPVRLPFRYRNCLLELAGSNTEVRLSSDPGNTATVTVVHANGRTTLQPGETISVAPR